MIDENILVIAVTAYAHPGGREEISGSKFDGYISKPFNLDMLYTVLSKFSSAVG